MEMVSVWLTVAHHKTWHCLLLFVVNMLNLKLRTQLKITFRFSPVICHAPKWCLYFAKKCQLNEKATPPTWTITPFTFIWSKTVYINVENSTLNNIMILSHYMSCSLIQLWNDVHVYQEMPIGWIRHSSNLNHHSICFYLK
jgi:hypothetical protein